jgi:hypothetical protein
LESVWEQVTSDPDAIRMVPLTRDESFGRTMIGHEPTVTVAVVVSGSAEYGVAVGVGVGVGVSAKAFDKRKKVAKTINNDLITLLIRKVLD